MASFTLLARPILSSLRAFQQAWVRCSSSTPEFIRPPGPTRSWTKDEYNAYSRWRYATDPDFRQRKIKAVKLYQSIPDIRVATLKKYRDRYANDPDHRQARLLREQERYANNPHYRQAKLLREKERYASDPHHRQAKLLLAKEHYANPHHRQAKLLREKERYANDPHHRKAKLLLAKERYANPHYRHARLLREKERYANDPHHRQAKLLLAKERYANDPEFRDAIKRRARERYWRMKHGVPIDQEEPQNSPDPQDKSK